MKLVINRLPYTSPLEECSINLEHLDGQHQDAAMANEVYKNLVKSKYDKFVCPSVFYEVNLVLVYDQDKGSLGAGKFKYMWLGPYIVTKMFKKGTYKLLDYKVNKLVDPKNGLYMKKYYAYDFKLRCVLFLSNMYICSKKMYLTHLAILLILLFLV